MNDTFQRFYFNGWLPLKSSRTQIGITERIWGEQQLRKSKLITTRDQASSLGNVALVIMSSEPIRSRITCHPPTSAKVSRAQCGDEIKPYCYIVSFGSDLYWKLVWLDMGWKQYRRKNTNGKESRVFEWKNKTVVISKIWRRKLGTGEMWKLLPTDWF